MVSPLSGLMDCDMLVMGLHLVDKHCLDFNLLCAYSIGCFEPVAQRDGVGVFGTR